MTPVFLLGWLVALRPARARRLGTRAGTTASAGSLTFRRLRLRGLGGCGLPSPEGGVLAPLVLAALIPGSSQSVTNCLDTPSIVPIPAWLHLGLPSGVTTAARIGTTSEGDELAVIRYLEAAGTHGVPQDSPARGRYLGRPPCLTERNLSDSGASESRVGGLEGRQAETGAIRG